MSNGSEVNNGRTLLHSREKSKKYKTAYSKKNEGKYSGADMSHYKKPSVAYSKTAFGKPVKYLTGGLPWWIWAAAAGGLILLIIIIVLLSRG